MANTLILYSTTDGHTREICSRLQQQLESRGDRVTRLDIEEAAGLEALIGAGGYHMEEIRRAAPGSEEYWFIAVRGLPGLHTKDQPASQRALP